MKSSLTISQQETFKQSAFPVVLKSEFVYDITTGLSKRELYSIMIMQGLASHIGIESIGSQKATVERAVVVADLLIEELSK